MPVSTQPAGSRFAAGHVNRRAEPFWQRLMDPTRTVLVYGCVALLCFVQACSVFTDADDEGSMVYVADGAAGGPGNAVGGARVTLNAAHRMLPLLRRGEVRASGELHIALALDSATGDLIWLHSDGLRPGRGRGWRAERLDERLLRKLVRQDSVILADAPWVRPDWPWTLTADGRFLGVSAVAWQGDSTFLGIMLLSTRELRYQGFVRGDFDGGAMAPAPDPCCLLARGTVTGGPDKLYRVNAQSVAIDDSFDVSPAPLLLPGPEAGQIIFGGGRVVSVYDVARRAVLRSATLPFAGPIAFDRTRRWIFAGDVGQTGFDDPGTGRVVALDATTLNEVWSMIAVPRETQQSVWSMAIGEGGKHLFVTSAPPPISGRDNGTVFAIDIERQAIVSRRSMEFSGLVVAP